MIISDAIRGPCRAPPVGVSPRRTGRLDLPLAEQRLYAEQASKLLEAHNIPDPQYVVLVDRNKYVQALMVYWMAPDRKLSLHRGLTGFHR